MASSSRRGPCTPRARTSTERSRTWSANQATASVCGLSAATSYQPMYTSTPIASAAITTSENRNLRKLMADPPWLVRPTLSTPAINARLVPRASLAARALHRAAGDERGPLGHEGESEPRGLRALEPGLGGLRFRRVDADAVLVEARGQAVGILERPGHAPVHVAVVVAQHEVALHLEHGLGRLDRPAEVEEHVRDAVLGGDLDVAAVHGNGRQAVRLNRLWGRRRR